MRETSQGGNQGEVMAGVTGLEPATSGVTESAPSKQAENHASFWHCKQRLQLPRCATVFNAEIDWLHNWLHSLILAPQFLDRLTNHASLGRLQHTDDLGRWYLAKVILNDLANDIAERP